MAVFENCVQLRGLSSECAVFVTKLVFNGTAPEGPEFSKIREISESSCLMKNVESKCLFAYIKYISERPCGLFFSGEIANKFPNLMINSIIPFFLSTSFLSIPLISFSFLSFSFFHLFFFLFSHFLFSLDPFGFALKF